jgi:excisionase family DNA binding protein
VLTEEILTVREVADRLKIHPETVRDWLRQGRLRGSRPGGDKTGWRVRVSEVDRFLASTEPAVMPPDRDTTTDARDAR